MYSLRKIEMNRPTRVSSSLAWCASAPRARSVSMLAERVRRACSRPAAAAARPGRRRSPEWPLKQSHSIITV